MPVTQGVSLSTGERGTLVPLGEGYRITSPEQRSAYMKYKQKREQAVSRGKDIAFTFFNVNSASVIEQLPDKHCGYLLAIQTYLGYNGQLFYGRNKNPMKRNDIGSVLNIKDTTLRGFINEMLSYGIFLEDSKNGAISVNPSFHFKGVLEGRKAIKVFSGDIRKLYKNVTAKDLGFLYRLIPYIHFRDNLLCLNPDEQIPSNVESINKVKLAEITGTTRATLDQKINRLKFGKYQAFADVQRGNQYLLYVNPMIFYRLNGYPDTSLQTMFLAK